MRSEEEIRESLKEHEDKVQELNQILNAPRMPIPPAIGTQEDFDKQVREKREETYKRLEAAKMLPQHQLIVQFHKWVLDDK